ncbi:MAG: asparaginase domain-containing protein [Candidatus Thermoplasmatota archaeon]|nr:asparaginase domain-containing protein [Candidatus Thermoplasmatota archaeon]
MTVKILVTGGTFDKEYMELTGELIFKNTHVHEMLKLARCRIDIKIRTLMMIDSLDMTDYHRNIILEKCRNSKEDKIIITHGTDTMAQTAEYLGKKINDKTIVLTGALIPYAFGSSDGHFNLGSALAFAQSLPQGVYIAMNGRYFPYDNVRKNRVTGEFEEIQNNTIES